MTTRTVAQSAHERFNALVLEVDADYCNNTFGSAPCTATGTQCYNTYGTCKDKANYVRGVKTFKFCLRGQAIPPGETLRPYINSYSFTPTEIPIGGGLATRSQTTISMADEACSDYEADKYAAARSTPAGGTFWTRFLARNYNIAGRIARVRKGYITQPFDWSVFQDELYLISSITGPDEQGNVQVVLTDVIRPLDKNMLPLPTNGKLIADCKAIANTGFALAADATHITLPSAASALDNTYIGMECYITQNTGAGQRRTISAYVGATRVGTLSTAWSVVPDTTSVYEISALNINVGAGKGTQYADPVATGLPQYVRIGKEIVRYTAIAGDVLSWTDSTYRAQFGTSREDHKTGDGIQLCFAPIAKSVTSVIQRLANAAGIVDAYLDLAGLIQEDSDWLGALATITTCIHTPEKASSLLNSLLMDINLSSWWDPVAQKQRFKADMPQLTTSVVAITPDEIIGSSFKVTPLESIRITRSFISFAPYQYTGNMTESSNFAINDGYIDANAESVNEYNGVIPSQSYSRWLGPDNALFALSLVTRHVGRLRDAPFKASFELDPRNEVHLADLIDVSNRRKTDASGQPEITRMRVTKYLSDKNFIIEATSTRFSVRYGFIAPDGTPDYPTDTTYAHVSLDTGLMNDGTSGFLII